MSTLTSRLLFSWKTSLVGLLSGIYAVAQPFINKDTSLSALVHDQTFILALVGAAIGFLSKDADAHGTPSAPIAPAEAAQIAAVAATLPTVAISPIGPAIAGSALVFSALAGDTTPVGNLREWEGIRYKKILPTAYEMQKIVP